MKLQFKNLYTVIAREVTTDTTDGMISIIKMIDKFSFAYNPSELETKGVTLGKDVIGFGAKYSVATSWYIGEHLKKAEPVSFHIEIIEPTGKNLGGPTQEQTLPVGIDKVNMNFNLEGLPIGKAGNYKLSAKVISKSGDVLGTGEYPFTIELVEDRLANIQSK
jgi:hypothetical protein